MYNKILLVDDDPVSNFLSFLVIRKICPNSTFILKRNGKEALDYLSAIADKHASPPGLIILDIKMPVIDGFEFMELYERETFYKNSEIIVLTEHPSERNKFLADRYGITHFLEKPLTSEKLLNTFHKIHTANQQEVESFRIFM